MNQHERELLIERIREVRVERYGYQYACEATPLGFMCGHCHEPLGREPRVADQCECEARVSAVLRGPAPLTFRVSDTL